MNDLTSSKIINENFFFIDSEHLDQVQNKTYGYWIDGDTIFDAKSENFSEINGGGIIDGSFILIQRQGNQIEIRTDYCGTRKLFLFQNQNYFAISNSFILLVDQLKTKFKLSLNEEFAYHLMTVGLCSVSLTETLINEIELIPRNFKVIIDVDERKLNLERIYYKEYFVPLDSLEGINILDHWFKHWLDIIRKLCSSNKIIKNDTTGGKDSRITLATFLKAGINLEQVCFRSLNYGRAIPDYEVALEIANHYNFSLNRQQPSIKYKKFSIEDILNISFYSKLGFHQHMHYQTLGCPSETVYRFTGFGVEIIRGYWSETSSEFISSKKRGARNYRSLNYEKSMENILSRSFSKIDDMFNLYDEDSYPVAMTRVYQETRTRHHFGGIMQEQHLSNTIVLAPMMDYEIHKIKVPRIADSDDLMIVLILERYCNELLNFRLEGGRTFNPEVLRYAKEINQKFPLSERVVDIKESFVDKSFETKELIETKDEMHKVEDYLSKLTGTDKFKNVFTSKFSNELYSFAKRYARDIEHHPMSKMHIVIAITKALMDVEVSEQSMSKSNFESLLAMVDDDKNFQLSNRSKMISALMKSLSTIRIEIQTDRTNLNIESNQSFSKLKTGYVVESDEKSINFKISCNEDIEVELVIQGKKVSGLKQSLKIDCTKFLINDESVLNDERETASKAEPIVVPLKLKSNQVYDINLSWEIHGYDVDEFVTTAIEFLNG